MKHKWKTVRDRCPLVDVLLDNNANSKEAWKHMGCDAACSAASMNLYLCRDSAARSASSHWSADYRTIQTVKGGEDRIEVKIFSCNPQAPLSLTTTSTLTICTLFSSSWGMANVEEGTCVRGHAPAYKHIVHTTLHNYTETNHMSVCKVSQVKRITAISPIFWTLCELFPSGRWDRAELCKLNTSQWNE